MGTLSFGGFVVVVVAFGCLVFFWRKDLAHGIDICSCLTKENRCVATSCKGACCLMDLVIRQAGTGVQLAGRPLTNFWRDAGPLWRTGWLSSSACFTSLWGGAHTEVLLSHIKEHSSWDIRDQRQVISRARDQCKSLCISGGPENSRRLHPVTPNKSNKYLLSTWKLQLF